MQQKRVFCGGNYNGSEVKNTVEICVDQLFVTNVEFLQRMME